MPTPSLTGIVTLVAATYDHREVIRKGLHKAGHAIVRPFKRKKKPRP